MSDNLELGRLEQNLGIAAVNTVDTALSRVDGRFSAPLSIDVGSDNAHTIVQNDLRFVSHIILNPGSPAASAAATITVTPTDTDQSPPAARDMGGFFVINKSGFAATLQITGQTNTAPVIANNSGGVIHVTSTGIWGHDASVAAEDVSFSDPIAGSPPLDNVHEALVYLLNNMGGGGGGGGAVASVFGRTGAVAAVAGDYSADKVSYVDPIAGSPPLDNVQEALDYALNNLGGGASSGSSTTSSTLVKKSANQTAANFSTFSYVAFDAEHHDDDGRHDNATNNDRITFSATDVGKVALVTANFTLQLVTAGTSVRTAIVQFDSSNAVKHVGGSSGVSNAGQVASLSCTLMSLEIASGDYVKVGLECSDTSITVVASETSFGVKV